MSRTPVPRTSTQVSPQGARPRTNRPTASQVDIRSNPSDSRPYYLHRLVRLLLWTALLIWKSRPQTHAARAHHDAHRLARALPDGLLCVGHAVAGADLAEQWRPPLIRSHRERRPAMVLGLVVEESMRKVVGVAPGAVVGGREHLTQIKLRMVSVVVGTGGVVMGACMQGST